jgi:hypothetical protein
LISSASAGAAKRHESMTQAMARAIDINAGFLLCIFFVLF